MSELHQSLKTIPNRFAFIDSIDKQAQVQPFLSLMLIDVVRFSDVSTSFGMAIGDQFLLEIANRIITLFNSRARLGRISGDVFALVFEGKHDRDYLNQQFDRLVEHFKTPMNYQGHAFIADFNVGAVCMSHGLFNLTKFVARAEAALKCAKDNQYDNFHVYSLEERTETGRSLALKADLTRALNSGELELYLQPKVNLQTLKIYAAECLLRWNHPLDGVLFPGPLIEAAESYNMINELANWTLRQAFECNKKLKEEGIQITLSVNISPTQLYDNKLIPTLQQLQAEYGVPLSEFELELTEDVALSDSLMVTKQLSQLQALGIAITVDDFGKGYSNLAYIRDLSLSCLKIDKTFVMSLQENPVNGAIIQAAKLIGDAKGCEVVAEGVETIEQLHMLRELSINKGQGYLFSPAVPLASFIQLTHSEIAVGTSPLRKILNK